MLTKDGELGSARRQLEQAAAGLWRGRPFGQFSEHPALVAEAARPDEGRIAVDERLLAVRLHLGAHVEVTPDLEAFVARHRFVERAWELLLEALYRVRPASRRA